MNVPNRSLLFSGISKEAIVTAVAGSTVVRRSSLQHVGVIRIKWCEGLSELVVRETSVSVVVVTGNKEFEFV